MISGVGYWVRGGVGARRLIRCFSLGIFTVLASCDDTPKVMPSTVAAPSLNADKPSQVSYNTTMNFSSNGMLRAILHAGRVQTYDQKRYTWLDSGVRVDFYNKLGLHSSVLTSASAKVNTINNNMTAYGHVLIVSDSGTKVNTDSLEWDNQKQTLHSEAAVHIVEKGGRITDGVGFESDQNLEHYHIMRPTIVQPSDVFGSRSQAFPNNPLKPTAPVVPGEAASKGAPGFGVGLSVDSTSLKR